MENCTVPVKKGFRWRSKPTSQWFSQKMAVYDCLLLEKLGNIGLCHAYSWNIFFLFSLTFTCVSPVNGETDGFFSGILSWTADRQWHLRLMFINFTHTVNPWISAQATYFKVRRWKALIWRGRDLFNSSQTVAWHDHFSDTSSAHKQQHKLFIGIKSWS